MEYCPYPTQNTHPGPTFTVPPDMTVRPTDWLEAIVASAMNTIRLRKVWRTPRLGIVFGFDQIRNGKRVAKRHGIEATQFSVLRCFALPDIVDASESAALESPNLTH